MKNWSLFRWALTKLKFGEDHYPVKCLKNKILMFLMDLSGVKPDDVQEIIDMDKITNR